MATKTIRYKCDFCGKVYASKSYCEKEHEPICFQNQKSKSCAKCVFLALEHCKNGKLLNIEEKQIIENPIKLVHGIIRDEDSFEVFEYYPQFLYIFDNLGVQNYCEKQKRLMNKLCTNCDDLSCA